MQTLNNSYAFFHPLRDYPTLTQKDHEVLCSYHLSKMKDAELIKESLGVCVAVNRLPWDSQHFGLPMARIDVLAEEGTSSSVITQLVSEATAEFKHSTGCQHFSIEVDVNDYPVMNACFAAGFEALDFKRTYFTNRLNTKYRYDVMATAIRPYQHSDREAVLALFQESVFQTRFTRDAHLNQAQAQQLYVLWAAKLLEAYPNRSNVLVFERNNKIEACGAIGEKDLTPQGVGRLYASGSIYAASSRGVGAYGAVLWRLTEEALAKYGLVDTTVSLNSSAATRVLEGVRPNRSVTHACLRLYVQ